MKLNSILFLTPVWIKNRFSIIRLFHFHNSLILNHPILLKRIAPTPIPVIQLPRIDHHTPSWWSIYITRFRIFHSWRSITLLAIPSWRVHFFFSLNLPLLTISSVSSWRPPSPPLLLVIRIPHILLILEHLGFSRLLTLYRSPPRIGHLTHVWVILLIHFLSTVFNDVSLMLMHEFRSIPVLESVTPAS